MSRESLFKNNEDYLNWDKYIENCEFLEGLERLQKNAAKEALAYLRGFFGEQFLRRAFDQRDRKNPHPLIQTIMMQAAWSRLWLIRFVAALTALEGVDNFARLRKRIKNSHSFAEGESVLEVAFQLVRGGFSISIDPKVSVTDSVGRARTKRPDMRIISDAGAEAIVEVSLLDQSEGFTKSEEVMGFMLQLLFEDFSRLTLYARMTDNMTASRVAETRTKLKTLAENAKGIGKLCTLVDDCIEAGAAPKEDLDALDNWAKERKISKGIAGPPVYSNDLARAVMKVRDKLAQLPDQVPGVIVIPATRSALFHRHRLEEILGALTEEICRYPKVMCLVLSHGYFGGMSEEQPPALMVANRTLGNILKEQSVVLMNPCCKFLNPTLAHQLHHAFIYSE